MNNLLEIRQPLLTHGCTWTQEETFLSMKSAKYVMPVNGVRKFFCTKRSPKSIVCPALLAFNCIAIKFCTEKLDTSGHELRVLRFLNSFLARARRSKIQGRAKNAPFLLFFWPFLASLDSNHKQNRHISRILPHMYKSTSQI